MNEYGFNFALEEILKLNLITEKNSEIKYIELSLEEIKSINNYFSVEPIMIISWIGLEKKLAIIKIRKIFLLIKYLNYILLKKE